MNFSLHFVHKHAAVDNAALFVHVCGVWAAGHVFLCRTVCACGGGGGGGVAQCVRTSS